MGDVLLQVHIKAGYGRDSVLRDMSFDLHRGEILGLVGTSGAGKSTLVMSLLGLLKWRGGYTTGEILFEGKNLLNMREEGLRRLRGKTIALVPQSPMTALNGALSLRAHFEEAWKAHEKSGWKALEARLAVLMPSVQLPVEREFLSRRPEEISVGQAQRVLIALALLHSPAILIADEPTSALDPVNQGEIVRLLKRLNKETGTTMLYISHDLISVLQLCDRMAVLDGGVVAECMAVEDVEHARHPSTLALLRSLPVPAGVLLGLRRDVPPEAVTLREAQDRALRDLSSANY
jgi:peptide/nickel transport system ATP-binding protein